MDATRPALKNRRLRRLLPLLALAALLAVPLFAPPVHGADEGVQVDDSLKNGLIEAEVIQDGPDKATLTVKNQLNVWIAVDLQSYTGKGPAGEVSLEPVGIFTPLGLIPPGFEATWEASFGPDSSQPVWAHLDFRTESGALAGVATVLSVMANAADGFSSPATPSKLRAALAAVRMTSTFSKLIDWAQRGGDPKFELWKLATLYSALASLPEERKQFEAALTAMGATNPSGAVDALGKGFSLLDLGRTFFDLGRAALGSGSGQVTFYRGKVHVRDLSIPEETTTSSSTPAGVAGDLRESDIRRLAQSCWGSIEELVAYRVFGDWAAAWFMDSRIMAFGVFRRTSSEWVVFGCASAMVVDSLRAGEGEWRDVPAEVRRWTYDYLVSQAPVTSPSTSSLDSEIAAVRRAVTDYLVGYPPFQEAMTEGVTVDDVHIDVPLIRGSWAGVVLDVPSWEVGYAVFNKYGGTWRVFCEPVGCCVSPREMAEEWIGSGVPEDFAWELAEFDWLGLE